MEKQSDTKAQTSRLQSSSTQTKQKASTLTVTIDNPN